VWASGCLGTWDGNGHNGGQSLPDRGQAADAHRRCRSCGRPVASTSRFAAKRPTLTGGADRVGVRMPGNVVVGQHLPDHGQPTLTGGAYRVGGRMPNRGRAASARSCGHRVAGMPDRGGYAHVAYVATPDPLWPQTPLPPVNAARANVGYVGGDWAAPAGSRPGGYIATPGPTGHNARERGMGERGDAGAGTAAPAGLQPSG